MHRVSNGADSRQVGGQAAGSSGSSLCLLLPTLQAQGLWGLNLERLDLVPCQKQSPASAYTCQVLPRQHLAGAVCLTVQGRTELTWNCDWV